MSVPAQENQVQATQANDKELNFRKQQEMYERKLEQERQARVQAEERAAQLEKSRQPQSDDDDDSDEPYVDQKRLKKTLNKFGEQTKQQTVNEVQKAIQDALEQERKSNYLRDNNDFQQVMSSDTVEKFANMHPKMAESILRMPDSFERQKLVYEAIKAMGVDKPQSKEPSIQEKVDANKRSPYYQPGGVGAAPYGAVGDFSPSGQKNAYAKMKELQAKLRI